MVDSTAAEEYTKNSCTAVDVCCSEGCLEPYDFVYYTMYTTGTLVGITILW